MKISKISMILALTLATGSIFTGCKKDDDSSSSSASPAPAITAKSDPQVKFKANGTLFNWVTSSNDVYSSLGIDGPPTDVKYSSAISTDFSFAKNAIDIQKGTTANSDSAAFHNYFAVATYPYSPDAVNGIVIAYWDNDGTRYATDEGSADQTGSSFKILDNHCIVDPFGAIYVNAKISFNCKVYSAGGASKTITDGVGVFTFDKFY